MQLANNLRRIFSEIPSISDLGFGSGLRRGVQAAKVPSARAELSKMVDVIDRLAAETRAGLRESSVMTTYDNDDKEIWRQFRRELIGEGFFSDDIWRFKGQLRQYLRVLNQNRLLEESIEESEVHVHDDLRFAFSNDVPEAQCYRQEPDKMKSAPFQTSRLTDETASSSVFSLDSRKQVECAGVLTKEETGSRADTGDSGHILDSSSTDDGYTDEEDEIADRALDRIRRARLLGRKDVRLSRRELLALEKKMDHQGLRGDREATGDGDKIANVLRWIFSENMGNA